MTWAIFAWRGKHRHKNKSEGLELAEAHLAGARAREVDVARVVEQQQQAIRANHFGPRIAAALREDPR